MVLRETTRLVLEEKGVMGLFRRILVKRVFMFSMMLVRRRGNYPF